MRLRWTGSKVRGGKAARFVALLATAGAVNFFLITPCYAGCLCNLVALSVSTAGLLICQAFLIGAATILFMKKWAISAKLAGVGAIALALSFAVSNALNDGLIAHVPGVLQNSSEDLESHWFVLLLIVILTAAAFISAYILPSIVAFRRNKENRKMILALNILAGWLPFVWNVLLFLSFADAKKANGTMFL